MAPRKKVENIPGKVVFRCNTSHPCVSNHCRYASRSDILIREKPYDSPYFPAFPKFGFLYNFTPAEQSKPLYYE